VSVTPHIDAFNDLCRVVSHW